MRVDGALVGVKAHSSLDFRRYTLALFILCICSSWYNLLFTKKKKHLHGYKQAHIFKNVINAWLDMLTHCIVMCPGFLN